MKVRATKNLKAGSLLISAGTIFEGDLKDLPDFVRIDLEKKRDTFETLQTKASPAKKAAPPSEKEPAAVSEKEAPAKKKAPPRKKAKAPSLRAKLGGK